MVAMYLMVAANMGKAPIKILQGSAVTKTVFCGLTISSSC